MALPVFVRTATTTVEVGGTSPIAVTITVNVGDYVVCAINAMTVAPTITSITGGGGTPAERVTNTHTNIGTQIAKIWSYTATSGAASVSVAYSGAPEAVALSVSIYSGVGSLGATGVKGSGAGSSADPNVDVTTTVGSSLVVGSFANWANNAMTAKNGSTVRTDAGGTGVTDIRGGLADRASASAASFNLAVTEVSGEWSAVGLELIGSDVGGTYNVGSRMVPPVGPRDQRGFLIPRATYISVPTVVAVTVVERRTLFHVGTRVGSRRAN